MKAFLRLILLAIVLAGAVLAWRKYRPAPASTQTSTNTPARPSVPRPDVAPRTWTDKNGRAFEGALVSAKHGQVIIRRMSDSAYFQVPANMLSLEDQDFVNEQISRVDQGGGTFVDQIPGHYTISRKLDIKGFLTRVFNPSSPGGWRTDRVDPMFWLMLSTQLHGTDSGSIWVRVDEKTFRMHNEGTLIFKDQLANFQSGDQSFTDSLEWSRPQQTIVEAQYGPNAKGYNVTHRLMRLTAEGRLPVEINPGLFEMHPHDPEAWELTVLWRTANGEVRRTLRDGSMFTWP